MTALDDLLDDIFDGKRPALYAEMADWAQSSRRFRAFATTHRAKIRSKLRNAGQDEARLNDVRAELEAAALLLHENRFSLEYEKYAATKQRGPDFTVTFKTHTPFNVEVRRIRSAELDEDDAQARIAKLRSVLFDKAGQMPPSIVNVLWLTSERDLSADDLTEAVTTLRTLAERKDHEFFRRRGFEDAADFLKQFQRLSGIILRPQESMVVWLNPLARHKAPPEIVNALQRLGQGIAHD